MLFTEANLEWQAIPQWADYLIQLGYRWPGSALGQRRIALVSMPCDSAAAGLIALGALIRDFGNPKANDVDGHYDSVIRYARQFLCACQTCDTRCIPERKHCGYFAEATGRVRYKGKIYWVSGKSSLAERRLVFERRNRSKQTVSPTSNTLIDLHIDGEPSPQVNDQVDVLPEGAYARIVDGSKIIRENLQRSFSGLCLAGRAAGEATTREICDFIRFRNDDDEFNLSTLLTVHGWSLQTISRIVFFNARTEQFDRRTSPPALVIADGDASFLKVLSRPEFQRSDIVGVVHRTLDREHLESIGNRMLGFHQWYSKDSDLLSRLPSAPTGISISILRKGMS